MAWDIMAGKKRDTMLGAERRSHHPRRDFLSVLSLRIWWLCMLRGERKALFDSCVYLTFRTYHLTTFVYKKRVPFHFISSDSQSIFRKCKHNLLLLCSIQHGSGSLLACCIHEIRIRIQSNPCFMTPGKSFCEPSSLSRLTAGFGGSGIPCRLVILLVLLYSLEGPEALILEKGGERRRARGGLISWRLRGCAVLVRSFFLCSIRRGAGSLLVAY